MQQNAVSTHKGSTRLTGLDALYARIKRIAARQLGNQERTLTPTALVNEAYLRLAGADCGPADDEHLVSLWARTMRHVLIDDCRARSAGKRYGQKVELDAGDQAISVDPDAWLDFEQRLQALERADPRLAKMLELRVYAGLDTATTAAALDVDVRTVQRDWLRARAWLAGS